MLPAVAQLVLPPVVPQQAVRTMEFDLTREGDAIARERLHLQSNISLLAQSYDARRELREHWNAVYEGSEASFELWIEFWTGPLHDREEY